ncbi:MAG TPA: ATP-binding protein [Hyalangium sp.]|nr:ATP-binding protein [Hyalangium sp.]
MSRCDPSSEGLADFLDAHSTDIMRRWQERVRESLSQRSLSSGELLDSLPHFLAAVVAALRGRSALGATPRSPADFVAEEHGAQRFRLGVDISAVVREYAVLREVILELLQKDDWVLELGALRLLLDGLATAMTEALRRYAVEHEQALRASQEELRQSELRYRLATLAANDAIWDWDIPNNQVHWSENIARVTGLSLTEVESSQTWWTERLHPQDRERVLQSLQSAVESTETHWMEEYRFQRTDGAYIFVNARGYLVRDAQGRALRMVGAFQDVTEHKLAEQEARRRADFEQHLIGIVSHDLRNPLNAILTAATLLLNQEEVSEPQSRSLHRILNSARRATRMLSDLLDFTQARLGGSLPVTPHPLDLHELTSQVLEEVQLAHPHRRIVLEQSGDGRGEWDGDRLAQLITNLVNNALTYGDDPCEVRVRTVGRSDDVVLSIHNQGKPIPAEMMSQLFQPLQRGKSKGSRGNHSIGLGLFIVKHIVDAHGGSIHVDSTAENGTTFTVRLPRHPPQTHPPPSP